MVSREHCRRRVERDWVGNPLHDVRALPKNCVDSENAASQQTVNLERLVPRRFAALGRQTTQDKG